MQYVGDNEFWCHFDAMKDLMYEENVATLACGSAAVSTTETTGPPIQQSKLSLSLKNNCKAGKMPPHPVP